MQESSLEDFCGGSFLCIWENHYELDGESSKLEKMVWDGEKPVPKPKETDACVAGGEESGIRRKKT